MRILIADKLSAFVPGRLQDLGASVEVDPGLDDAGLATRLGALDPEVLVVRSTKVRAAHIAAAPSLALIIRAGAGVNTIDLDAASTRGVYVTNCPGKNASAVAELTIAHLLNLDRRIADNVATLRAGQWNKKALAKARGLRGRTLALLGYGAIGREVATIARAMGMRVIVWSRFSSGPPDDDDIEIAATPEAAVSHADAVSVHLPLAPDTAKRVGPSVFAAMRTGAYFVNTSRGEVVDQAALLDACETRGIRAGLDVYAEEPSAGAAPFEDASIRDSAHVYGTHHIGASTEEAEDAVGAEVVRIVAAYAASEPIPNCVNLAAATGATHAVVVRHADRVGVLAHVLGHMREASLNVQGMTNTVFLGGAAAVARIEVVGAPTPELLRAIASSPDVFAVSAKAVA